MTGCIGIGSDDTDVGKLHCYKGENHTTMCASDMSAERRWRVEVITGRAFLYTWAVPVSKFASFY